MTSGRHYAGRSADDDATRALDALWHLSSDCPRDEWLRLVMAAKSAGVGMEDVRLWSARATERFDDRDFKSTWNSISPDGEVGPGTLFAAAKSAGWRAAGDERREARRASTSSRPSSGFRRNTHQKSESARGVTTALEVWARCELATDEHGYVGAKQGMPTGLRQVPANDPLCVGGVSVAGCLAVPLWRGGVADSELESVQYVPPPEVAAQWKSRGKPGKLTHPGPMGSGWLSVTGGVELGDTIFVVEGVATGWACARATGQHAVVCFGASRIPAIVRSLRARHPTVRIVLVPDRGMEADAEQVALEHNCFVAEMPDDAERNFDACDFALAHGHSALAVLLAEAGVPAGAWAVPEVASVAEWASARLNPGCIVENYLFADVAILIAPGSTGKTTATLYEAICIVLGRPLWGLTIVKPGPVLVVTAEDRREFLVARLREICLALHLDDAEQEQVRRMVRIDDRTGKAARRLTAVVDDVVEVSGFAMDIVNGCRRVGFAPVLAQFDPMVSFGVGEARVNDAEQGLVEAARVLMVELNCCVRLIHHTGKSPAIEKRVDQYSGRGGSALADGARMVSIMQAVTFDDLLKATGRSLRPGETAFALHRAKMTFAPPQDKNTIYVVRQGYRFEHVPLLSAEPLEEVHAEQEQRRSREVRGAILDAAEAAWKAGTPASRTALAVIVKGFRADEKRAVVEKLLVERWLLEVPVPEGWRPVNNSRKSFMVRLDAAERDDLLRTGALPTHKTTPPPSIATPPQEDQL